MRPTSRLGLTSGVIVGIVIASVCGFVALSSFALAAYLYFRPPKEQEEFIPNVVIDINADYQIDYRSLEVGQELGEGAFGKVFKGIFNGTEVAIKKIHSKFENDEKQIAQFLREAETNRRLKPHVINYQLNLKRNQYVHYPNCNHKNTTYILFHYLSASPM